MTFRIIRLSEDYGMAIIVSPENAKPEGSGNRYWLLNDNKPEFEKFKEVNFMAVLGFFSGHADGMGFAAIPNIIFEEIKDAEKWVLENQVIFEEKRFKTLYENNPEAREELEQFVEETKRRKDDI